MNLQLVIGNKNYSTWSLRPWLLLKAFNVHFEEVNVSLAQEGLRDRLLEHSPSAKVPVLIERDLHVWDSLAICEYVNDVHLEGKGWPHSPKDRAKARTVTSEMHSGFFGVRGTMPMNIRARRRLDITQDAAKDIARIEEIWADHHRSGWLFESFSIADCFYAPVAFRFLTYGVELNEAASQYMHKLLAHPALEEWVNAAKAEAEVLDVDEAGEDV
jgi:glutathione S-transferase